MAPGTHDHGVQPEAILVDKVVTLKVTRQVSATDYHQTITRLGLQLSDRLRQITLQQRGVPLDLSQRPRRHELGHLVHTIGQALESGHGRPDVGEGLVGLSTEQERIGVEHLSDHYFEVVLADELSLPAATGKLTRVAG